MAHMCLAVGVSEVRMTSGCGRKYKEGRWDGEGGLEEQLRQEKRRTPQGAVYLLGCRLDAPGTFYLAFITNVNPHREYFTVSPDGFYFRHEVSSAAFPVAHARGTAGESTVLLLPH